MGDTEGDEPSGTPSGSDPGRVTIHRLNRAEYDNTVRDLLGTSLRPAAEFPADDHSFGFDNIADTLTLSPLQLELYERAAETLADDVLSIGVASSTTRYEAETIGGSVGSATSDAWNLYSNGDVTFTQTIAQAGTYRVRVRAWQDAAGPDAAQMSITVSGQTLGPFDVAAAASSPVVIEQEVEAGAGLATVMVSFLNDYYDDATSADRNLYVDWIEVEGPIGATSANPLRDKLVTCEPADEGEPCAREIISSVARRAFRRTPTEAEVDKLMGMYQLALDSGDDENEGLKLAFRGILTSPHFLFRVEIDEEPDSKAAHLVSGFELASRLSYFLWSSMPDDELLDLGESGELLDPEVLKKQVDRMLDDPKSQSLVDNFAGQWLFLRALADKVPNSEAFPDFDEQLRASMKKESDLFFKGFLADGGPSLDQLVMSDATYLDDRLATFYGIDGSFGADPKSADVAGKNRGGLLRQGAWLTLTSNPDRTSPVKRGKWILENLLCSAPPPPPPGVEGFKPADLAAKTQKELLAAHRADPKCSGCHAIMDPLGLALENYDGIGRWRTKDKTFTIDATGDYKGQSFSSPEEFMSLLVADPRLSSCAVQKVFTYALGRGTDDADKDYLTELDTEFRDGGMRLRDLIKLVVTSEPFLYRHGEPPGSGSDQGGEP